MFDEKCKILDLHEKVNIVLHVLLNSATMRKKELFSNTPLPTPEHDYETNQENYKQETLGKIREFLGGKSVSILEKIEKLIGETEEGEKNKILDGITQYIVDFYKEFVGDDRWRHHDSMSFFIMEVIEKSTQENKAFKMFLFRKILDRLPSHPEVFVRQSEDYKNYDIMDTTTDYKTTLSLMKASVQPDFARAVMQCMTGIEDFGQEIKQLGMGQGTLENSDEIVSTKAISPSLSMFDTRVKQSNVLHNDDNLYHILQQLSYSIREFKNIDDKKKLITEQFLPILEFKLQEGKLTYKFPYNLDSLLVDNITDLSPKEQQEFLKIFPRHILERFSSFYSARILRAIKDPALKKKVANIFPKSEDCLTKIPQEDRVKYFDEICAQTHKAEKKRAEYLAGKGILKEDEPMRRLGDPLLECVIPQFYPRDEKHIRKYIPQKNGGMSSQRINVGQFGGYAGYKRYILEKLKSYKEGQWDNDIAFISKKVNTIEQDFNVFIQTIIRFKCS